jgi:hypothetical protein
MLPAAWAACNPLGSGASSTMGRREVNVARFASAKGSQEWGNAGCFLGLPGSETRSLVSMAADPKPKSCTS